MIHTLSQLPALGYCVLAFVASSIVAAIADYLWKFTDRNSLAEAVCALYRMLGAGGIFASLGALLVCGLLNLLRLVGAL